jgi:hypothetical protein
VDVNATRAFARRAVAGRVIIGVMVVVATTLAAPGTDDAHAVTGECADNVGITIVVDFQDLGGGVNVVCAPGPVSSGLDALHRAGVAWEGTTRFPSFVCRIAGKPGADREPCTNTPPATAYWAYWIAPRGGPWCYSNVGAASRTPPPGTIEGWSFSLDNTGAEIPPPRFTPPGAIAGTTPNALRGGECTTPAARPQVAPSQDPTRPAAPAGVPGPEAPVDGAAAGPGAGPVPTTGAPLDPAPAAGAPEATPDDATSTTAARAVDTREDADDDGAVAINAVDLSDDGGNGSGSPAGVILAIAVAGALAAGATTTVRRRRRAARVHQAGST